MDWEQLLKTVNYFDGDDEDLIDEAIAHLEQTFKYTDKDELLKYSRHIALPYLALKKAKRDLEKK